jgi:hypothetical protein
VTDIDSFDVWCPYCGEPIELLIDPGAAGDSIIEDCSVCCRPIEIAVAEDDDGALSITVKSENEI